MRRNGLVAFGLTILAACAVGLLEAPAHGPAVHLAPQGQQSPQLPMTPQGEVAAPGVPTPPALPAHSVPSNLADSATLSDPDRAPRAPQPGASGRAYYVSRLGSNGDGRTWLTAWNELDQIHWDVIRPGDSIFLDGGFTEMVYATTLIIRASGTPGRPILIALATDPGRAGRVVIDGGLDFWTCQATGPSPYHVSHPQNSRRFGIDLAQQGWIVIDGGHWDGVEVRNHNEAGVHFGGAHDIRLKYLHIHHNSYADRADGPGIDLSGDTITLEELEINNDGQDAIQGGNVSNFVLQDSYLHDHYCTHPDGIQLYYGTSHSLTIRRNTFAHGFLQAIFLGERQTGHASTTSDVDIVANLIYDCEYGIKSNAEANHNWKIYHNTIANIVKEGLHLWYLGDGGEVRDNIVYRASLNMTRVDQSNNLFYEVPDAPLSNDSLTADPRFVNPATGDYRLQPDSPARGRGVQVGAARDLAGRPIAPGGTVDIGAFAFIPDGAAPPIH